MRDMLSFPLVPHITTLIEAQMLRRSQRQRQPLTANPNVVYGSTSRYPPIHINLETIRHRKQGFLEVFDI